MALLGQLNDVERHHAPRALFVAGDPRLLRRGVRVAVVGAREASRDGVRRAEKLSRELVAGNVTVVSGLARGVDTAAHRAAIDAGGRTIAVLGTPLDVVSPRENQDLQQLIMRDHLALSQFPSGQPVHPGNFPVRNRLMALISDATVIVEAGDTSGTISQGWEALRLGRSLWILRSVADDEALNWPEQMIAYGAQVLSRTTDLLAALPPVEEPEVAFSGTPF